MHIVGEIGGGMGKKAAAIDAQGFFLQPETAFQKMGADRFVVGMQHGCLPRARWRSRARQI